MIKNYLRILLCGFALSCNALPAFANFNITAGSGTAIFSFNAGTTPAGTSNCNGSGTSGPECTASVPINVAGSPLFVTGNAGLVTGTGGTFPATQSGTWTVQPGNTANTTAWLVTGTGGVFPVTAASGSFASGSFAAGSHASGSFASGAFASGALASGSVASGAIVDLGAQADSVCGTATGTCSLIALAKYNNNALNSAIPNGSNIIGKVGIDQTTFGTTNGVVSAAINYQAVAASQTAAVLQTSTGATGDYLSHCTIYPTSVSPGVVTVFDGTNTAANSAILFAGGSNSTSNLVPFVVPVGAKSVNGAWKVTTGSNISIVCEGKFS